VRSMVHLALGRGMGELGVVCFMLAWCTEIPFTIAIHVRPATAVRSTSCKLLISCGVGLSGRPGASSTTQMSSHCSWLSMHRLRGGRDNSSSANLTSSEPNLDDVSSRLNFENQTAISSLPGNIANVEDRQAPQSKLIQWWTWRQDHYFESLWTELGMILCPRSTVLASFAFRNHFFSFLTTEKTTLLNLHSFVGTFIFACKCLLSPKILLLPYLFQMNILIGLVSLLVSIDDMFTFIMNPQSVVLNEVLSAVGIALLATMFRVIGRISGIQFPFWLGRISDVAVYADPSLIYLLLVSPSINIAKAMKLLLLNVNFQAERK